MVVVHHPVPTNPAHAAFTRKSELFSVFERYWDKSRAPPHRVHRSIGKDALTIGEVVGTRFRIIIFLLFHYTLFISQGIPNLQKWWESIHSIHDPLWERVHGYMAGYIRYA